MTCRICGKALTGAGSFLGIGPVCAKHRAEAMQPRLIEGTETAYQKPIPPLEDWEDSDNFEVIDFDALRGIGGALKHS